MAKVMPVCEVSLIPPNHESLVYFKYSVCIILLITPEGNRCSEASWRINSLMVHQTVCHTCFCCKVLMYRLSKRKTTIPSPAFAGQNLARLPHRSKFPIQNTEQREMGCDVSVGYINTETGMWISIALFQGF